MFTSYSFFLILFPLFIFYFFFFNDTATTEIYTLSLHDALPILRIGQRLLSLAQLAAQPRRFINFIRDRKSTRLNSSHLVISYAVFCLKKKKSSRRSLCLDTLMF